MTPEAYTDEKKYVGGVLVEQTITIPPMRCDDPEPEPEPDTGGGGGTGPTVPDPKDPPPEGPVG